MLRVAALFVEKDGCYYGLDHVDPWDKQRDTQISLFIGSVEKAIAREGGYDRMRAALQELADSDKVSVGVGNFARSALS